MFEIVLAIIFALSLCGVVFILFKKLPELATLPKNGGPGLRKYKAVYAIENKVKKFMAFFSDGILLHRSLSWLKCKVIKVETLIDKVLHNLRKKAKEQKARAKR